MTYSQRTRCLAETALRFFFFLDRLLRILTNDNIMGMIRLSLLLLLSSVSALVLVLVVCCCSTCCTCWTLMSGFMSFFYRFPGLSSSSKKGRTSCC